jgi:sensor histidine kinase regulating citrate/malate metabolism
LALADQPLDIAFGRSKNSPHNRISLLNYSEATKLPAVATSLLDHIRMIHQAEVCRGILEEVRRYVFDPFFTTRRGDGKTGLGLYIVHNLVTEQLGGRVTLDSEREKGTTISMTLPLLAPGYAEPVGKAARKT